MRPSGGSRWLEDLRHAVVEVMPGADVEARPFQPFERTLGQPRFLATLLGTLNVITLILAVVGIFGVVNHGAAKRTREMGIRMALGATAARIRRMVIAGALVPAMLGDGGRRRRRAVVDAGPSSHCSSGSNHLTR